MKHGKNPTKAQKSNIAYYRLNPEDWLVSKVTTRELCLVHRFTNKIRWINRVYVEKPKNVNSVKYGA
jgi:hypothetical protein